MSSSEPLPDMEVTPTEDRSEFLDRGSGRTVITVRGMPIDDSSPESHAGWVVATRRSRPAKRDSAEPQQQARQPGKRSSVSQPTRAQFAQKVNAAFARAARMPNVPLGEHKVVVRPRGGLLVGKSDPLELIRAVAVAARIELNAFWTDTACPNVSQNILVISTPSEERAGQYDRVREISLGGRSYEVFAYRTAPENTAKGVIDNISQAYTPEEIHECVVHDHNPTALAAHRIGDSRAVIVLFQGVKVPSHVNFAGLWVRCRLYRQHKEECRTCGKIGHRKDVCPHPDAKVCFACGRSNPGPNHANECKPRCKLCGDPHASGTGNCRNKYKTPFLVSQREQERKMAAEKAAKSAGQKAKVRFPGKEEFPKLREPELRHESRSKSRERGKSGERRRSQSRNRKSWAAVATTCDGGGGAPGGGGAAGGGGERGERRRSRTPARKQADPMTTKMSQLEATIKLLQDTIKQQQEVINKLTTAAATGGGDHVVVRRNAPAREFHGAGRQTPRDAVAVAAVVVAVVAAVADAGDAEGQATTRTRSGEGPLCLTPTTRTKAP
ncbi:hypothetical protein HPB48_020229 [Haemaphysalis longicornis]|uniref:CCHC-type domain-containing protein n=1 Tax=Haemaphysalis longicornis TaxID=44386 RepID=A0A9J6F701_HAELO|nr:hypothetical protein HPB48_020229 [Haemaphysalis longicornis]